MGEGSYVKSYDGGVRIEIHNAQGFVPTKITSFLMNLHVEGKPIFIRYRRGFWGEICLRAKRTSREPRGMP